MVDHGPETIKKYERAAENRYSEAAFLLENKHRLAGVYLFGYAIEMWISAAYFRLRGYIPEKAIDADARNRAAARARFPGIGISRQHDLVGWARLLVAERRAITAPATAPPRLAPLDASFAQAIVDHSIQASQVWGPALRYSPFVLDQSETDAVEIAAKWFKDHYGSMSKGSFMPVIRSKLRPPGETLRAELVGRLVTELTDGVGVAPPRPVIFELPDEVMVVWEKWEGLTHNDRASIILEAYRTRETQTSEAPVRSSQVLLALGATPDEAIEMGLLPYSIQSSIQRGQPGYEAILELEKNEGAIETRWGWELRFPSRELAKEAHDRLRSATATEMPEVLWQPGQQVGRVGHPYEARDT